MAGCYPGLAIVGLGTPGGLHVCGPFSGGIAILEMPFEDLALAAKFHLCQQLHQVRAWALCVAQCTVIAPNLVMKSGQGRRVPSCLLPSLVSL